MPALFSSFVWHLAGMRFVQVDRLERGFCYSYGMLCDSSDTNDALGMYFKCILFMNCSRAVRGAKLIGVNAPTSKAVFILLHRAALVQ